MSIPLELQAARFALTKSHYYLRSAMYSLRFICTPGLGTVAVDAWWRLYYDPEVLSKWGVAKLSGALYHEILHLLRDHHSRMEHHPDKYIANLAGDIEINDDLCREKIPLPEGVVLATQFGLEEGLLIETYYELLDRMRDTLPSMDGAAIGRGRCGSCAHGQREEWELPPEGDGREETVGTSKAVGDVIRRDVAREIVNSKGRGDVPASLVRWAENIITPPVNPWKKLHGIIQGAVSNRVGMVDYSYSRPSRRQGRIGNGKVIFPSLVRPQLKIAVVVDTSGSIGQDELRVALGHLRQILQTFGQCAEIFVLSVDSAVHTCQRMFSLKNVELLGGGGTDMGAGIEYAEKKLKPSVIIVITDGLTDWPSVPPRSKVIIGFLRTKWSKNKELSLPSWASAVVIDVEGEK